MLTRIKYVLVTLLFSGMALAAVPAVASADFKGAACNGVQAIQSDGCNQTTSSKSVSGILKFVISLLSIIVGFTAVVMLIIGGFKYITSQGDTNSVAAARSTIIYSVVGLMIVALAQILVHFVLEKVH